MSPKNCFYAQSCFEQGRLTLLASCGCHDAAFIARRSQHINTFRNLIVNIPKRYRMGAAAGAFDASTASVPDDGNHGSDVPKHHTPRPRPPVYSNDTRQLRIPLVDAVRERGDAVHEAPFHVPGHKRGAGTPKGLEKLVRPATGSVLQYDLTEIAGLDFLSSPGGVIQEAQELAAEAFGADQTWFLVNGCSVGIHAAVMAVTAAVVGKHAAVAKRRNASSGAVAEKASSSSCIINSCPDSSPRRSAVDVIQSEVHGDRSSSFSSCSTTSSRTDGRNISDNVGRVGATSSSGGATLIVARNCHVSTFSAMVLAGCEPCWVQPELDPVFGLAHCVTHESIRAALHHAAERGRQVAGVLIVSPTYFGAVADVEAIAAVCHEYDVPLIVDEAHGGHFAFLPSSSPLSVPPPPSALQCGADIVIQSTHKVLGSMTQSAMIHKSGATRVCPSRLSRALQTLQSSSPSYVLMASLDAARAQAVEGRAFEEPCAAAQVIREAVSGCQRVRLLDEYTAGSKASVRYFDPLRLTLRIDNESSQFPGDGFGTAEWLERQYGVVPELATAKTVVLALGPGTTMAHATTAATAILELDRLALEMAEAGPPASGITPRVALGVVADAQAHAHALASQAEFRTDDHYGRKATKETEVVLSPREAYFAATESVPTADAVGLISAELLCPYPPGIPVLFPGERITTAALEILRSTLTAGGVVTGAHDSTLATLEVIVSN